MDEQIKDLEQKNDDVKTKQQDTQTIDLKENQNQVQKDDLTAEKTENNEQLENNQTADQNPQNDAETIEPKVENVDAEKVEPTEQTENQVAVVEEVQKEIDFDDETLKNQANLLSLRQVGNALSNIGIACLIISFLIVVGGIMLLLLEFAFVALVALVLVLFAIATLGLLLLSEEYKQAWRFLGGILDNDKQMEVINFFLGLVPYIIAVGTVSCLISIIFLSLGKNQKSVGRIVATSICSAILLVLFIMIIAGVINGGVQN